LINQVMLIYSNRERESTAFLDELRDLEQQLPHFRLVLTMTQDPSSDGETRKDRCPVFPPLP
jgi:ferredoxin-NADP reductase